MAERDLVINELLTVPETELDMAFSRSSGAGGQNVNKVNSRVELRYRVRDSSALPPPVKARLMHRAKRRITSEGELLIISQRYRDQGQNIRDAYEKLRALIDEALIPPVPRIETRPTRGSKERRISEKKHRSSVKQNRRTDVDS